MADVAVHLPIGDRRDVRAGRGARESFFFEFFINRGQIVIGQGLAFKVGEKYFLQFISFFGVNNVPVERPDLRISHGVIEFLLEPEIIRTDDCGTADFTVDRADN